VAFAPDGGFLVSGSRDGTVRIWMRRVDRMVRSFVVTLAFDCPGVLADGSQLATGSRDTTVRIWDSLTGRMLHACKGHGDWVTSVAWSPMATTCFRITRRDGLCLGRAEPGLLTCLRGHDGQWPASPSPQMVNWSLLVPGRHDPALDLTTGESRICSEDMRRT